MVSKTLLKSSEMKMTLCVSFEKFIDANKDGDDGSNGSCGGICGSESKLVLRRLSIGGVEKAG